MNPDTPSTATVIAYDRATTRHETKASIYETRGLFILGWDEEDDDADGDGEW